jgi:hypothetical protein
MRRLSTTRPRKRRRRYDLTAIIQRQVLAGATAIRVRPAKRIFRPATPFHS